MLTDTLMDEMQPVVLENKRFDSQEKSIPFALSGFFSSLKHQCLKLLAKNDTAQRCSAVTKLITKTLM